VKFLSRTAFPAWLAGLTVLVLIGAVTACSRQEISVYDVPKDAKSHSGVQETASSKSDQQPQAASPTSSDSRWNAPSEWKSQAPGPMQDAKFIAADGKATITISIFEGSTGGVLANVNRWRTQLGLPPVDEAGLASLITNLDSGEAGAKLVDMTGSKQRMVGAIVPRGSKTWFFKLTGDPAAVGAEKERFLGFIKSTKG
jgi:hypothetical protein